MAKYIYEAIRDPNKVVIGKNKFKVAYEDRNFVYFKKNPDATLEHIRRDIIQDTYTTEGKYFWENFYLSLNHTLLENRSLREYIKKCEDNIRQNANQIEKCKNTIKSLEKKKEAVKAAIHPSVMIVGGNGLDKAFSDLQIHASCLYRSKKSSYEVWELMPEDFEKIDFIKEENWQSDWGWWRTGHCILEGAVEQDYYVNGKLMYGYSPMQKVEEPLRLEYPDYLTWLSEVMQLSNEKNVAIFATSLAKDNGMTLDEFMRTFQP